MVRTLIISTLGSALASESGVLMQSQSNADGTLAMLGMNDQFAGVMQSGSGRVQKMQKNMQAMEDQYKSLIQDIISSKSLNDPATGTPWIPAQDFLVTIETQFDTLKKELNNEADDNRGLLADAHAAIAQCNTDRNTAFHAPTTGTLAIQAHMQASRGVHSTCRGTEDAQIADMESKCQAFDALGAKCHDNQDWYAQYNKADITVTTPDSPDNTLREVVEKATACKGAVDTVTDTSATCDENQHTFRNDFCAFARNMDSVCNAHTGCYDGQMQNLLVTRKSVHALEVEQKTIFRMIGKVECYLDVLLNADNKMPEESDITTCSGATIDDSVLTIVPTDPVAKDQCLQHTDLAGDEGSRTHRPGVGSWYTDEMVTTGLDAHSKLNSDEACVANGR
jgi:hypothetical protein